MTIEIVNLPDPVRILKALLRAEAMRDTEAEDAEAKEP